MSLLRLSPVSLALLPAQVRLNGTFHHTLQSLDGRSILRVAVSIEQCDKALEVLVTFAGNRHTTSVVLDKSRADTSRRVVRFIEGAANGELVIGLPEVDEDLLASDMERNLRRAIRTGRGTWHLIADELEPCLLINRTRLGYTARIELDDAQCYLTLPADTQRAYAMLADNMSRFLQGYRDSLAAAA